MPLKAIPRLPAFLLVAVIRLYQLSIARLLPDRCRFYPSCSHYAIDALRRKGLVRGGAAAAWRVMRCGPWTAGGFDPVVLRSGREAARG